MDKIQFKQTVISTACVGALVGLLPVLGGIALRSERDAGPHDFSGWLNLLINLAGILVGCVASSVVLFGLLPMAIQYGFVKLARRWTGRD